MQAGHFVKTADFRFDVGFLFIILVYPSPKIALYSSRSALNLAFIVIIDNVKVSYPWDERRISQYGRAACRWRSVHHDSAT